MWTGRKMEQRKELRRNLYHDPRRGGTRLGKGKGMDYGKVGVTANSDEDEVVAPIQNTSKNTF